MTLRIGSLCSGVGMLDMAVMDVLDAEVAWHAQYEPPDKNGKPDTNQYAAQILAHRFPGVPNHGDITAIDFRAVEQVDMVTAGWPCQDMSLAGRRAGMRAGTRSGVWTHVVRAIEALQPRLVFLENVRSLTSAWADSDVEPCPWCLGDPGSDGKPVQALRALGCALGDFADLGFDAEWATLPASAIGAPHKRERCFILAWPRDSVPSVALGAAPNPEGDGRDQRRPEPARILRRLDAAVGRRTTAPDAPRLTEREPADLPDAIAGGGQARTEPGDRSLSDRERERERERGRQRDQAAADTENDGRQRGRDAWGRRGGPEDRDQNPHGEDAVDWGRYTAAIRRWESVMGRPAPEPTEPGRNGPRLSPALPEWMMGLPGGWVTDVPGIPRNAQLHAIGNGVVVQHGSHALRLLLPTCLAAVIEERAA